MALPTNILQGHGRYQLVRVLLSSEISFDCPLGGMASDRRTVLPHSAQQTERCPRRGQVFSVWTAGLAQRFDNL